MFGAWRLIADGVCGQSAVSHPTTALGLLGVVADAELVPHGCVVEHHLLDPLGATQRSAIAAV